MVSGAERFVRRVLRGGGQLCALPLRAHVPLHQMRLSALRLPGTWLDGARLAQSACSPQLLLFQASPAKPM